jgi:hypothetical protein
MSGLYFRTPSIMTDYARLRDDIIMANNGVSYQSPLSHASIVFSPNQPAIHDMQDSLRLIALEQHTSPPSPSQTTTSIQSEIAGLARQLTHLTAPLLNSHLETTSIQFEIPPLNLSCPSLQPRLEALGISGGVVGRLVHAFVQHAENLQKICVTKFEESCHQLMSIQLPSRCLPPPDMIEKLRSAYRSNYEQLLGEWVDQLIPSLLNGIATSTFRSNCVEASSPVRSKVSKFNPVSSLSIHSLPIFPTLIVLGP